MRPHSFGVAAGLFCALSCPVHAAPEQAKSADSFVDSIGINTHWDYPDTPYGSAYGQVKALLIQSGIRHVRGDFSRVQDLAKSGVRTMVGVSPGHNENGDIHTVERLRDQIKAANAVGAGIDWVEGPNEPDLFWQKSEGGDKNGFGAVQYKGQGYPQGESGIIAGVVAFQKDLYTTLKADPATAKLKVVGPALGKTYGYDTKSPYGPGALSDFVDFGCFHPYPGGNPFSNPYPYDTLQKYIWHGTQPSANMDEARYAFDVYAPPFAPKPMVASETGYSTFTDGQTEAVQAKYIPRLFCEYFRQGVVRTYLYEFLDAFDNKSDRDSNFGLVRHDLTPKPSYGAVRNLIAVLSDKGAPASFAPGALDLTLAVSPVMGYKEPGSGQTVNYDRTQYVHHLLLQKAGGDFYLVLWHDISDEDGDAHPHRVITPPDMPTTVTLPATIKTATVYRINDSADGTAMPITNGQIALQVPDRVIVVKLSPGDGAKVPRPRRARRL